MRFWHLFPVLTLLLGISIFSVAYGQAIYPGKFNLTPYAGIPNMKKWVSTDPLFSEFSSQNQTVKGFGHIGIRFEYVINEKLGIGIDGLFSPLKVRGVQTTTFYDGNTDTYTEITTVNTYIKNQIRLIPLAYFHFYNTFNWDLYLSGGVGVRFNYKRAYQDEKEVEYSTLVNESPLAGFPLCSRISFGARYFFTRNIGVNAEVGFGGPLLSLGCTLSF